MQGASSVVCPVCGVETCLQERCPVCGATLGGPPPHDSPARRTSPPPSTPSAGPAAGGPPGVARPPAAYAWDVDLTPKFAGFWIRTLAYLLDSFLVFVILSGLVYIGVLGYTSGAGEGLPGEGYDRLLAANIGSFMGIDLLVKVAYFTYFLGRWGQTPAKKLFGLRVIRTDGTPVTYVQAMLRTLGYYVNRFTLWIGFLWVAVDSRKQGLHDKIAGTLEIREGIAEVHDRRMPPPNPGRS